MLDVMVDKNDACQATADGKSVLLDAKFYDAKVPNKMIFYKNKHNPSSEKFIVHTKTPTTPKPDAACMGQWVFLSNVLNFSQHESHPFTDDSALMLNWKDKVLGAGDTLNLAVYMGTPNTTVKVQHYEPKNKVTREVYFEKGSDQLSPEGENIIQSLVKNLGVRPKPILIEGYTDSSGDPDKNLELSQGRIANVSTKMQMFGIKYKMILTKSHGEFYANEYDDESGKNDRKVVITAWK
jgi:outer membrane protein OmpA-like peptidoglycan-associated protein